jgi:hypothetical protein
MEALKLKDLMYLTQHHQYSYNTHLRKQEHTHLILNSLGKLLHFTIQIQVSQEIQVHMLVITLKEAQLPQL